MSLIYVLIVVFVVLILYPVFLGIFGTETVIEGLENNDSTTTTDTTTTIVEKEYQPYNVSDPNNSLILAQQNAGNIEVLRGRIDNLDGVKT